MVEEFYEKMKSLYIFMKHMKTHMLLRIKSNAHGMVEKRCALIDSNKLEIIFFFMLEVCEKDEELVHLTLYFETKSFFVVLQFWI